VHIKGLMDVTFAAWAELAVGLIAQLLLDLLVVDPGVSEISMGPGIRSDFVAVRAAGRRPVYACRNA
jgi:hypothetical protein